MDARFQRRVQRYGWDKSADVYDRFWAEQLTPARDLLFEMARLRPGERVLDLACGTGLVTFPAAEAVGAAGEVVGTDISERMVAMMLDDARARGFANVRGERADAEDIRFEDGAFDAVLCSLGLMYVPDPVASLKAARRVLRDGGRAVVSVWGARGNCGWAEIFPIVDARVQSEVCPMFFQLGTGESLRYAYENAGFGTVEVRRITTVLHYRNDEEALGAAFAGGPVALAYSRFDEGTRDEAHAEYLASIAGFRNGDGYEIPGEFVVGVGER